MASSCPVLTSKSWKTLVDQVGEDLAWTTWEHYDGYPSTLKSTSALKRELAIPRVASPVQVRNLAKRVRQYNTRNKTSHSFSQAWIGESQSAGIHLTPNYLPVNIERRRQRDFQRSEKDKMYYDFSSPAVEGIPKETGERTYEELTEEEKILATYIDAPLDTNGMMEMSKYMKSGLTKNNIITALTDEFKEWFGPGVPTNQEVEMYRMANPVQMELFEPTNIETETEITKSTQPIINKEKQLAGNIKEAAKEGMALGEFVSMDEAEFDQLFPEYDWMNPMQKQTALRQLMNANIKLTCGL